MRWLLFPPSRDGQWVARDRCDAWGGGRGPGEDERGRARPRGEAEIRRVSIASECSHQHYTKTNTSSHFLVALSECSPYNCHWMSLDYESLFELWATSPRHTVVHCSNDSMIYSFSMLAVCTFLFLCKHNYGFISWCPNAQTQPFLSVRLCAVCQSQLILHVDWTCHDKQNTVWY